jgi:fluoride exporter
VTVLLVAAGAFVGAPLRFVLAGRLDAERFPYGTLLVNVVGSFLLGLLSGAAVSGDHLALLGVGFCGGLTTYSSFAVQAHRLGWGRGAAYAATTLVTGLAACAVGYAIGQP